MKLFIAAVLVALAAAAITDRRPTDDEKFRDTLKPSELTPFKSGVEYVYRFDSQIASGIAEISDQKALTRIQCLAKLYFTTDRLVTMRLEKIRMGSHNGRMVNVPSHIQKMSMVEEKQLEPEHEKLLQLPLQFTYADGLIERIIFHSDDDVWSKNIKRSVLNLLNVNLKAKNLPEDQKDYESEQELSSNPNTLTRRMYTIPETTLEGLCPTTYVINKLDTRRENLDFFNISKTIDFENCEKLSDVYYGPQAEKRPITREQAQKKTADIKQEQTLDRSTIFRHLIVGTPEKFAIKKVESISQYVFKTLNAEAETPMMSVVSTELVCVEMNQSPKEPLRMPSEESREESLVYSVEFDREVKRFYMYGDEEYPSDAESPFSKIPNKKQLVLEVVRTISKTLNNKNMGIESEASIQLPRLVELIRTCSVTELRDLLGKADRLVEQVLLDAYAIAGTRNTIYVLAEKIVKRDISIPKAIHVLKALNGVPAPSDKQVDILIRLCKSEVAKQSEPLQQTCWLTAGALMGELCETTQQNNYIINKKTNDEVCPQHVADKFIRAIMDEYKLVETRYEKIVLLKAFGNAGIKPMVNELEKIIYDEREDPIVRVQAIDSLRRLREEIPERIQSTLMPIFRNSQEPTEVRLQALSLIMQTIPGNSQLDQIAYVLLRERSRNVRSFVYDTMKQFAESPIEEERKLSNHLKALVKLAGIDEVEEEKMRSSHNVRFPLFSSMEGVFVNWESMYSSDNTFPKKISASMDTFLNDIFEKNTLEIQGMQENLERFYQKMLNTWMSDSYNGRRSSSNRDELRNIFTSLGIKSRREEGDETTPTRGNTRKSIMPFGVLSLRIRDIDFAVLPLEQEFMPEAAKKLLNGEKPSVRDFEEVFSMLRGQTQQAHVAWNFYERMMKVPTTAGIPIKLTQSMPVLAYFETNLKLNADNLDVKFQPSISVSHVKKIEAWCPVVNSGVENVVSIEANIPLEGSVQYNANDDQFIKLVVKVPDSEKRLFGFHSLPITFVRNYDRTKRVHVDMDVKTIHNELLEHRLVDLNERVYGAEKFGLPFHMSGHIHRPIKTSYVSLIDAYMTSENHMHLEFKPAADGPQRIELNLDAKAFEEFSTKVRPTFSSFYGKFDEEMEKTHRFTEIDSEDDEQKLNKYLQSFEPRKMYKHALNAELKTVGGSRPKSSKLEMQLTCDDTFGYCKGEMEIRRDPLMKEERREWKLISQVQYLLPEYSHDLEQHLANKNNKHQKFVCAVDCQWGEDEKQSIQVRVNGEQAKTKEWVEIEESETKKSKTFPEKTAFLNKYDISAEYKLECQAQSFFTRWFDLFKGYNFWTAQTEVSRKPTNEGLITALVVVDPISREHLNISVKTPTQKVRIHTVQMPMRISPFPLIRRPMPSISSMRQLMTSVVAKKESPKECIVDGTNTQTFDGVTFKAPITKCFTVLAKDCSNERPRFAILMKKDHGSDKILKVAKDGDMVEIEPTSSKNFRFSVNEEEKTAEEMPEHGFTVKDGMVVYSDSEMSLRFDGRKAWIKVSQLYKNRQCGLCGHYDDDDETEFRKSNNELTSDLREYHKSYTLRDGNCDEDLDSTLQRERFETIDSSEFQKKQDSGEIDSDEPIEKTRIMEFGHKICFSMKPVPDCPKNRYPGEDDKKDMKVQFGCLQRDAVEARQILRKIRNQQATEEIVKLAPSFVETIRVPTKCEEY